MVRAPISVKWASEYGQGHFVFGRVSLRMADDLEGGMAKRYAADCGTSDVSGRDGLVGHGMIAAPTSGQADR